jgi:hypothetical protein
MANLPAGTRLYTNSALLVSHTALKDSVQVTVLESTSAACRVRLPNGGTDWVRTEDVLDADDSDRELPQPEKVLVRGGTNSADPSGGRPDGERRHEGARSVAGLLAFLAWIILIGGLLGGLIVGFVGSGSCDEETALNGCGQEQTVAWVAAGFAMFQAIIGALFFFAAHHVILLLVDIAESDRA